MTGPTSELLQPGRGDIWLAALSKGRSGELGKTRPVVVVSPDDYGPYSSIDSVVVVPLSASARPGADRVALSARQGLDRDSVALTRAVRGLARSRLLQKVSHLEADELAELDYALAMSLGLRC